MQLNSPSGPANNEPCVPSAEATGTAASPAYHLRVLVRASREGLGDQVPFRRLHWMSCLCAARATSTARSHAGAAVAD